MFVPISRRRRFIWKSVSKSKLFFTFFTFSCIFLSCKRKSHIQICEFSANFCSVFRKYVSKSTFCEQKWGKNRRVLEKNLSFSRRDFFMVGVVEEIRTALQQSETIRHMHKLIYYWILCLIGGLYESPYIFLHSNRAFSIFRNLMLAISIQ